MVVDTFSVAQQIRTKTVKVALITCKIGQDGASLADFLLTNGHRPQAIKKRVFPLIRGV